MFFAIPTTELTRIFGLGRCSVDWSDGDLEITEHRFTIEQIIHKLREADVLIAQGKTVPEACKQIGVSDKTYFRWRRTHGGLRIDQAKRMRELEAENARLKKAVPI